MQKIILYFLICYLVGSLNSAYIITYIFLRKDIRNFGDGNAGTTNVFLNINKFLGIVVFIFDFLKGFFLVKYGIHFLQEENIIAIGFAFAVLGHDFPVFLNFIGGTGIAMMLGGFFAINFNLALTTTIAFIIIYLFVRTFKITLYDFSYFVESEALSFIVAIFLIFYSKDIFLIKWLLASLLVVVFKHREKVVNILHLRSGV